MSGSGLSGRSLRDSWPLLLVGALVVAILGGLIGAFVELRPAASEQVGGTVACNASNVASTVLPSLVEISVQAPNGGSVGTGSVIDSQGHVLTNNHVVEPGTKPGTKITATLSRGGSVPATIVGRDPLTDVAVIQLAPGAGTLTPIALGSSANAIVGQPVVALGSALGLTDTVTTGIVSALDRVITVGGAEQTAVLMGAIQTDAAINPGNSGGPLVDCDGKQIGMNSAGASPARGGGGGSVGLNFAIPIDVAMAEAHQLIATGKVNQSTIGILGVTVTDEMAKNTGRPHGVLVDSVVPGSPAEAAGIRPEDVITKINGTDTPTVSDYLVQMLAIPVGSHAAVTFIRAGQTQTASCLVVNVSTLKWSAAASSS